MKRVALLWALGVAVLAPLAARAAGDAPDATLDHASVPAAGRHAAVLTVSQFGRYALSVTSSQGTSLQVVDRMAGPGAASGSVGEKDGRLDLLLERGQYKLLTEGHAKARGAAQLAVRAFTEKNAPRPPQLVELKPVDGALGDLEQLSYWIEIKERRTLALEAAGRNLADLRLWQDGTWLVDAEPARQIVQPRVGKPLMTCRLSPTLGPGLYLLTAYGGAPQAWAEDDGAHPFHLRFGIPRLGIAGRSRHSVGPFGTDRYLVPGPATYFRLELPEATAASLGVGELDSENPFHAGGQAAEITKKSLPPVAEIGRASGQEHDHVVTVSGAFGQPYVLQHFEARNEYPFDGSGDYWLSTIHSGHPEDSVDATAIVTRRVPLPGTYRVEPWSAETIALDAETGWARRANLLDTLTLFFQVKQAGSYEILSKGTEARFRIEPFLTSRPAQYKAPDFRGTGSVWDLGAGYFVLTVEPVKKGILDVAVRPRGLMSVVLDSIGLGRDVAARPVRPGVRFPKLSLDRESSYIIYMNQQPEVRSGVIVRRLPLDLREPLPIAQQPGETVTVPFHVSEAATLRAEAEDGSLLDVAVDAGSAGASPRVEVGDHTLVVRHAAKKTLQYTLLLEPLRLQASAPLPALPDATLAALPQFPVLTEDTPRFVDLERTAAATFLVRAAKPGLYHLQSTGLLATEGNLRTRTVTSFARESQNGSGRNFLVQQYLREGDYQLSVAAQGLSAGHLGLKLERTALVEGGFITSGLPARISLPAGAAVAYRFVITKPGTFRVRTLGLGRQFRWRLEDEGGWPIEAPNGNADVTRRFEPGRYRLVLLPEATEARALTLIEPVLPALRYKGHGPHVLPLARQVEHVWLEPAEGQPRVPDTWQIDVAAPIDATLQLGGEMQGTLLRVAADGSTSEVAFVPPARGFKGALDAGRYRLDVTAMRRNNRAPYSVAVWPEQLVPGGHREVTAPVVVAVSVGRTGLVELGSFGSADVRARLEDEAGRVVAASDDRPDDWNFLLTRSLSAGRYRLYVDPVGATQAQCTIAMRVPVEAEKPALALPASIDINLGRSSHLYPLTLPATETLLLAVARSGESVGIALEGASGDDWRTIATATGREARLEIPLAEPSPSTPGRYRMRVWSLDRRDSPVHLSAVAATPARIGESRLRDGVALGAVSALLPALGAAIVDLERPGLLKLEGAGVSARWSSAHGLPCQDAASGLVAATGTRLWLVGDVPARGTLDVRAGRLTLAASSPVQLPLPAAAPLVADLAPGPGGPLLVLASSQAGQPGVRVGEAGAETRTTMAVGARGAVAVALRSRRPAAQVWAAEPAGALQETRLESWSFPQPERVDVRDLSFDGALKDVSARAFTLGDGAKRIHLALGASLVAALSKGDEVLSVHWAGGAAFAESVDSDADRLTLLHTGSAEDRFSVDALPLAAGQSAPALAPGAAYEQAQVRAGRLRLALAPGAAATLHVRGASEPPVLVSSDGRVVRGADIPTGAAGGTLTVPHGPGLLLAWVDRPGQEGHDLWARERDDERVALKPPASVALNGTAKAFRLEVREPVVLHLRTAAPAATLLRRGDGPPDVDVHPSGAVLDAYLPAGRADLVLRAFAGGALSGTAEITTTPVTPIAEGLGPEVLLAPGATRIFAFNVSHEGLVGVGVRASADVVESTLLTSAGRPLPVSPGAENVAGVVQMATLQPGTYLLALHAPVTSAPVTARPAVAGLTPPDTGPPEDVVRRYLEPDEAPPSFSATHASATTPRTRAEGGTEDESGLAADAPEESAETPEAAPEETPEETPEEEGPGGVRW